MKTLANQVPVTGLEFDHDVLFSGVGTDLKRYNWRSGEHIDTTQVFNINKVHGIKVSNDYVLVWGHRSLRILRKASFPELSHPELTFNDWIIYACISKSQKEVYVLTAHNKLVCLDIESNQFLWSSESSERSILYSGVIHDTEGALLVASGTVLNGIVIWNVHTKEILWNLTEHEGSIFGVAFSSDASILASCSDDRSIITWDLRTGKMIGREWGHGSRIWQLKFVSNDSQIISCSEDLTTRVWNIGTTDNKDNVIFRGHKGRNIWSLATTYLSSPDNTLVLATGGADSRIMLWSLRNDTTRSVDPIDELSPVPAGQHFKGFSRLNGKTIAITSSGAVFIKSEHEQAWVESMKIDESVYVVRPIGNHIVATTREGSVFVFDTFSMNEPSSFKAGFEKGLNNFLSLNVDGVDCVLLQSQDPREPLIIYTVHGEKLHEVHAMPQLVMTSARYWNGRLLLGTRRGSVVSYLLGTEVKVERDIHKIFNNHDAITSIEFMYGHLLVASRSGHYGFFDTSFAPVYINKLQQGTIEGLQAMDDGSLAIYGFKSDDFFIWNATYDYEVATEECGGSHRTWTVELDPSQEGKFCLMFTRAGSLNIVEKGSTKPAYKKPVLENGTHGREVRGLEFSPLYPNLLATGSEDTCVSLAMIENGKAETKVSLRKHVSGIQSLHWSPDGKYLLTGGAREELFVWRIMVSPPQVWALEYASLPSTTANPDLRIMDFSIIPMGDESYLLACAYSDSTITIWKFDTSASGNGTFELLGNGIYRECSLLNINLLAVKDKFWLVVTSTDGHLVVWTLAESWSIGKPALRTMVHQSGIRTSAISIQENGLLHFSGGDDNSLAGTHVSDDLKATSLFSVRDAHSSTVTGISVREDKLFSTGADQKIRTWSLKGELIDSRYTSVSDTGVLDLNDTILAVGGSGLALYEL